MLTEAAEGLRQRAAVALAQVRERWGGAPYSGWDTVFGAKGAKTLRMMLFEEVEAVLDEIKPGWRDIE